MRKDGGGRGEEEEEDGRALGLVGVVGLAGSSLVYGLLGRWTREEWLG